MILPHMTIEEQPGLPRRALTTVDCPARGQYGQLGHDTTSAFEQIPRVPLCQGFVGLTQSCSLSTSPNVPIRSTVMPWARTQEAAVQRDEDIKKGLCAIQAATTDGSIS